MRARGGAFSSSCRWSRGREGDHLAPRRSRAAVNLETPREERCAETMSAPSASRGLRSGQEGSSDHLAEEEHHRRIVHDAKSKMVQVVADINELKRQRSSSSRRSAP